MYIKNDYLYFETNITTATKKKISGHSFVGLAGLDKWNKRGDVLLELLKLRINKVDPKYLRRGDMAEKMVGLILKAQGKNAISYDEEYKKAHYYDCLGVSKVCGGIPDFEIFEDKETVEVKSKNISKYNEIKIEMPKEEVYQGLYYTYMRKHDKLRMAYVFFDDETEKALFEGRKPKTLDNCKILMKYYTVNREEIGKYIEESILYYNTAIINKRIPVKDISPKVLEELKNNGSLV